MCHSEVSLLESLTRKHDVLHNFFTCGNSCNIDDLWFSVTLEYSDVRKSYQLCALHVLQINSGKLCYYYANVYFIT